MNEKHLNIANHIIGVLIGLNLISYYFGLNKSLKIINNKEIL
jgi:hypothetical protein